jgi:AcrR family transcriptional regulator
MSTDPQFRPQKSPSVRPGASTGRRAQNRLERTRALCEGALGLFLERGLVPVTIEEITKAAGVSKGSFYRYFDHKAHLVSTLIEPLATAVLGPVDRAREGARRARTDDELLAVYAQLAAELVPVVATERDLIRLYLQERLGPPDETRQPIVDLADALTERAIEVSRTSMAMGMLVDEDPRVSTRVVLGATHELLLASYRDDTLDPLTAAQAVIRIVMEGVGVKR